MKRVAHLVVSVMSRRPIRWMAPTARLRSAAMTRGPEPVRAVELSSRRLIHKSNLMTVTTPSPSDVSVTL